MLGSPPPVRAEATRRFWSLSDPDPTTRVNEAKLEYWTRVARVLRLLFSDSWNPRWDARAPTSGSATARPSTSPTSPRRAARENPQRRGARCASTRSRDYTWWAEAGPIFTRCAQVWEYPQLRHERAARGPGELAVLRDAAELVRRDRCGARPGDRGAQRPAAHGRRTRHVRAAAARRAAARGPGSVSVFEARGPAAAARARGGTRLTGHRADRRLRRHRLERAMRCSAPHALAQRLALRSRDDARR